MTEFKGGQREPLIDRVAARWLPLVVMAQLGLAGLARLEGMHETVSSVGVLGAVASACVLAGGMGRDWWVRWREGIEEVGLGEE